MRQVCDKMEKIADDCIASPSFFERRVADHMTKEVIAASPESSLREIGRLFAVHDFNAFPVVENKMLLGVVSKYDFMRAFIFTEEHPIPDYTGILDAPVREFMREELLTVAPDTPLTRVLQRMVETRTRSFPVVNDARLVGVISREDVMRALEQSASPLTEFSTRGARSHLAV